MAARAKDGPVIGFRFGTRLGGAGGAVCSGTADLTVVRALPEETADESPARLLAGASSASSSSPSSAPSALTSPNSSQGLSRARL